MGPNCFVEDNVADPNMLFDDSVEVFNMALFEFGFNKAEFEFNCFAFSSGEISQLDSRSGGDCCNTLEWEELATKWVKWEELAIKRVKWLELAINYVNK